MGSGVDDKSQSDPARKRSADMENIRRYGLILVFLAVIAVIFAIITSGISHGRCNGILIQQSKDTCLLALATSTNNASICSELGSSYATQCYVQIALATSNYALCGNAYKYDNASGSSCYAYFANQTGNAALCSYVKEPGRDQCFVQAAIRTYDVSYCHSVLNSTEKVVCTDSVSVNTALKLDNVSYCSSINGTYSSNETVGLIAGITGAQKHNASTLYTESAYFEYFPQNVYSKSDICYFLFSAIEPKANYCAKINDTYVQEICTGGQSQVGATTTSYTNSSYYNNLLASCSDNASTQSLCQMSVLLLEAVQTKNTTICSKFNNTVSAECYGSLASTYSNTTYCGYISNSSEEYSCVLSASGNNYNAT